MTLYAAAVERFIVERTSTGNPPPAEGEPMPPAYTDAKTLPTIATPSVPPNSRVLSLTAEPTPALSALSDPMIASVAGAVASPSPPPRSTICTAISRYEVSALVVAAQARPAAKIASPPATTTVVPIRSTTRGPRIDATPMEIATGSSRTPVSKALYSLTNWKYWVMTKMKPNSARKPA